jgi:hypothetical protein
MPTGAQPVEQLLVQPHDAGMLPKSAVVDARHRRQQRRTEFGPGQVQNARQGRSAAAVHTKHAQGPDWTNLGCRRGVDVHDVHR